MPKRTIALLVVLILITASLLYIAFSRTSQPVQDTTAPSATPTPVVQTKLMITPNPLTISSASGTLTIDADTGSNVITAVQLELQYDPKVLTNVNIAVPANGLLQNPVVLLKNIDRTTGKISYSFGIQPTGTGVKGVGPVATLTFTTLTTTGQTAISFGPDTKVTAEGQSVSVLKESMGTTIMLTGRTNTSTSSAPLAPQATTSAR